MRKVESWQTGGVRETENGVKLQKVAGVSLPPSAPLAAKTSDKRLAAREC